MHSPDGTEDCCGLAMEAREHEADRQSQAGKAMRTDELRRVCETRVKNRDRYVAEDRGLQRGRYRAESVLASYCVASANPEQAARRLKGLQGAYRRIRDPSDLSGARVLYKTSISITVVKRVAAHKMLFPAAIEVGMRGSVPRNETREGPSSSRRPHPPTRRLLSKPVALSPPVLERGAGVHSPREHVARENQPT